LRFRARLTPADGALARIVGAILSIQTHFSEGGFDIATGDVERLSGKPPRPLRDVLTKALAAL
jgi:NAD(P)H dehydrogenase (quinone)